MKCCVPSCINASNNTVVSEEITFHSFPHELHLCAAWLRVLGVEDCHLPDPAFVCSLHFLNDDFYETTIGFKKLQSDAVPSIVHVCIACLDTESRLYSLRRCNMEEMYENLTGILLRDIETLPHTLCLECTRRLKNCYKFREKSLRANTLLINLVEKHKLVTMENVKTINRVEHKLTSNILKTVFDPDYCDIYILECSEEDAQVELNRIVDEIALNTQKDTDRDLKETVNFVTDAQAILSNMADDFNTNNDNIPINIIKDDVRGDYASLDAQAELEDSVDKVIANIHKFTAAKEVHRNTFYCSLADAQTQLDHFVDNITASLQDTTNVNVASDNVKDYNVRCNTCSMIGSKIELDHPVEPTENCNKCMSYYKEFGSKFKIRASSETQLQDIKNRSLATNVSDTHKYVYKITENGAKMNKYILNNTQMKSNTFVDKKITKNKIIVNAPKQVNSKSSDYFSVNSQRRKAIGMTIKTQDIIANMKGKILKTSYLPSTELKKKFMTKDKRKGKIFANTYKLNKVNRKPIENPWATMNQHQDINTFNIKSKTSACSSNVVQAQFANTVENIEKNDNEINKKKANACDYALAKIQRRVHKIVGKASTKVSKDSTSDSSLTSTDRGLVYCGERVNNHMDTSMYEMKKVKSTHSLVRDEQKKLNSYEDGIVNNVDIFFSDIPKTTAVIGIDKKSNTSMLDKHTKSVHFSDIVTIKIYEDATNLSLQSQNLPENVKKNHEKTVDSIFNSFSKNKFHEGPFTEELHTIKSDCLLSDPKTAPRGILNKLSNANDNEITKKVINKPESSDLVNNFTVNIEEDNYWNKKKANANKYALKDIQTEINIGKVTKKETSFATKEINKEGSDCTLIGTKRQVDYINEISANINNQSSFNMNITETKNYHLLDKQKKLNKVVGTVNNTINNVNKNCMIVAENKNNIIFNEQAPVNIKNKYLKPDNCSSLGVKLNKIMDEVITNVNEVTTDIQKEYAVKELNIKDYFQINLQPQTAQLVNTTNNRQDNAYNNNFVTKTLPEFGVVNDDSIARIGYEQKNNYNNTKGENMKNDNCSPEAQMHADKIVDKCPVIILEASSNNEHRCVGIFTGSSEETNEDEVNAVNEDHNSKSYKQITFDTNSSEVTLDDNILESNSPIEKKSSLDCIGNPVIGRTGSGTANHMVWFPVKSTIPIAHKKIKKNKSIKQKLQSNKDMKKVPSEIHTKRRLKRVIEASKLSDEIGPLATEQKVTSSSEVNDQITEISIDHCFDNKSAAREVEIVQPEIKSDEINETLAQDGTSFAEDNREVRFDVSKSDTGKDKIDSGISELRNNIIGSMIKVMNCSKKRSDINVNNNKSIIPFENSSNRNIVSKRVKGTKFFELKARHDYADHSFKTLKLNNIIKKNAQYLNRLEKKSTCDLQVKKAKTRTVSIVDNVNKTGRITLGIPSSLASDGNKNSYIDSSKAEEIKIAESKANIETCDSNSECSVNLLNHTSTTIIARENKGSTSNLFQYKSVNNTTNIKSINDLDNLTSSDILKLKDKCFNLNTSNIKTTSTAYTTKAINYGEYRVELTSHIPSVNKNLKTVDTNNASDANNKECLRVLRHQTHCGTKTIKSKYLNAQRVKKNMTCSTKLSTDRNKKNLESRDVIRKILSCDGCDYETDKKKYMESHVLLHTGKKDVKKIYPCTYCKYKTKNRHHLEYHLRTHTGEKPFNCSFCEHKFARKTNLVNHMRTHTGEKPFSCKFCSYRCTDSSNLKTHMRTHTKEKPFSCKFCNYTSIQSSTLVSHMRKHTGEKPFACDVCHKKFSGKGNLIKHQRTHLDIRPYVCKICQNKFSQKSNLLRHLKIHSS